jgi:hypothetical protein
MGLHAIFDVVKETPEYIYIKDVGHTTSRSVTNDAEWVLVQLEDKYNLGNRLVFYMDSDGQIDEIIHTGAHFISFQFGHEGFEL